MSLDRLSSTTQQYSRESVERAKAAAGERQRRVEAMEGVEGDRQRSLRQELAEAETPGPVMEDERMRAKARQLAENLRALGRRADALLRMPALHVLDDRA